MKSLLSILVLSFAFATFTQASPPINEECPVCGKAGRLIYRSYFKDKDGKLVNVIFNSSDCKDKFDKDNAKYIPKIKRKE